MTAYAKPVILSGATKGCEVEESVFLGNGSLGCARDNKTIGNVYPRKNVQK